MSYDTLYLIISGASTARRVPELLRKLCAHAPRVITVLTPSAQRIVSPRELATVSGHRIVDSYFDAAILPRPPPGVVLVAPCSFNSLNKLALGIADNLAMSITAEAIGRATPVFVAVSTNPPLWDHPRARQSAETLRQWGCHVLDPVPQGDSLTLAPDEALVAAVSCALDCPPIAGAAAPDRS